jgi:tetratricopeptide (TPR) repeat protein
VASILAEKGEVERAKEVLWTSLRPPVSALFGVEDSDSQLFVDYGSYGYGSADEATALMQIAREQDTVDAFLQEFEQLVRENPGDDVLSGKYRNVLQQSRRWETLLAVLEKGSDSDTLGAQDLGSLALAHRELGQYERAIEAYERQARFERAQRWSGDRDYSYSTSNGIPPYTRFTWGTQGSRTSTSFGSSSSSFRSYGDNGQDRDAALVALHLKLGHTERAAELERALFSHRDSRYQDSSSSWVQLAHACEKLELWKEAEDFLRRGLATVEPEARLPLHEAQVELGTRRGDPEARRSALAAWIAILDEKCAKDPYDASRVLERAFVRARCGEDLPAARADLERALELEPSLAEVDHRVAWVRLELGDAEQALAGFRRAKNRSYQWQDPETSYGLGLAIAAVEGVESARPTLRRALAEDPENLSAPRARALLQ